MRTVQLCPAASMNGGAPQVPPATIGNRVGLLLLCPITCSEALPWVLAIVIDCVALEVVTVWLPKGMVPGASVAGTSVPKPLIETVEGVNVVAGFVPVMENVLK